MGSIERRDFYIAKIQNRIPRLRKAIDEKNIAFDITSFIEQNNSDLKIVEAITEELVQNSSREDSHDVKREFLEIQEELDTVCDAFDKMLQRKTMIKTTNYSHWMWGRMLLAVKYNKWKLLCHVITINCAIVCHLIGVHLHRNPYCTFHKWAYDLEFYWIHKIAMPGEALEKGCMIALVVAIISGLLCFACSFRSVRKRSKDTILWVELVIAAAEGGLWLFVMAVCSTGFMYIRLNDDDHRCYHVLPSFLRATILTCVAVAAQIAIGVLNAVHIARRKRRSQMVATQNETELLPYAQMGNNQDNLHNISTIDLNADINVNDEHQSNASHKT